MNKTCIEIEAKKNVDVFGLTRFLAATAGVLKACVVTGQSVRIYYNADKLQAKKLLKVIASYGNRGRRGRKANIVTLREIKQSA